MRGTISRISQRDKGYGLLIGNVWYGGPGKCRFKVGDEVEFEFTDKAVDDRVYHNITKITKIGGEPQPHPSDNSDVLDKVLEMQLIPKIHVGVEKEVEDRRISAGSYDKILVKKYAVNLTTPLRSLGELTKEKVRELQEMAEKSIEEQIPSREINIDEPAKPVEPAESAIEKTFKKMEK